MSTGDLSGGLWENYRLFPAHAEVSVYYVSNMGTCATACSLQMSVQMSFLIQFLNQQGLRATETLNLKAACSCEVKRENILFLLAADHRHNNFFNETSLTQVSKPPEGRQGHTPRNNDCK